MADEAANSIQDVFQISKHRAGNCIALKPCKAGGLTQTKKVAGIAEAAGIGLYGGTMIESSLRNSNLCTIICNDSRNEIRYGDIWSFIV